MPPQACPPNLPSQFYLKAKHQLHRGPSGQDAVIGMADEEEVQDTQEEHKGCGDPKWEVGGVSPGPDSHFLFQDSSHPQAHHGPSHLVRLVHSIEPSPLGSLVLPKGGPSSR